jgi:hypothetical protein
VLLLVACFMILCSLVGGLGRFLGDHSLLGMCFLDTMMFLFHILWRSSDQYIMVMLARG